MVDFSCLSLHTGHVAAHPNIDPRTAFLLPSFTAQKESQLHQLFRWAVFKTLLLDDEFVDYTTRYPLVIQHSYKHHHFLWENPLWQFSIANCLSLPEGKSPSNPIKPPFSHGFPMVYRRVSYRGWERDFYSPLRCSRSPSGTCKWPGCRWSNGCQARRIIPNTHPLSKDMSLPEKHGGWNMN